MKSPRRRSREFALQGVYQHLLSGNSAPRVEEHAESVDGFSKADDTLYRTLLRGTLEELDELSALIAPLLDRKPGELSPVERAILLMGAYELKSHLEVPYRVVINEAIELAKAYGGTDGHKYVNGVLDKLAGQLRAVEVAARAAAAKDA
jgi:N utilization substance protein B